MRLAIHMFLAVSSLAASPALAQGKILLPMEVEKDVTDNDEVRKVAHRFANCVVRKRPEVAALVVLGDSGNADILKAYPGLVDGNCLVEAGRSGNSSMRLPGSHLRFLMADALVQRELSTNFPDDFSLVPPLTHKSRLPELSSAEMKKLSGKKLAARQRLVALDAANILLGEFGECVARADPKTTHRLLSTDPASAAEKSALNDLQPALGGCLPKGQTLRLSISATRRTLAQNFYRLSKAVPVAVPGAAR